MMRKAPPLSAAAQHPEQRSNEPTDPIGHQPATATIFAIALAIIPAVVLLTVLSSLFSDLDIAAALQSGFGKWAHLN